MATRIRLRYTEDMDAYIIRHCRRIGYKKMYELFCVKFCTDESPSFEAFKQHAKLDLDIKIPRAKKQRHKGYAKVCNGVSHTYTYGHVRGWHWIRTERYVTQIYDPDYMFLHLDGNKLNCLPENLYPVKRNVYYKAIRRFGEDSQLNKAKAMIYHLESMTEPDDDTETEPRPSVNGHLSFSRLYGIGKERD